MLEGQGRKVDVRRQTPVRLRPEAAMDPWHDRAKGLLKREMTARKLKFRDLSELLTPYGIEESPDQLNRKVNRGKFSAAFLFACLNAMKVDAIVIPDQLGR